MIFIIKMNIIESIKICKLDILYIIYFTPFPYYLYNSTLNSGNMALNGIGLGLIYYQRLLWISNIGLILSILYSNKVPLYYINYSFFLGCLFLNIISNIKSIYLMRYFSK